MTNIDHCRWTKVVASLCLAALTLGHTPFAPRTLATSPSPEHARTESVSSDESPAFTFIGFVNEADGTPAEGAIVVSSAGGQAVTGAEGSFRLEVRVPSDSESIQLTAVGRSRL